MQCRSHCLLYHCTEAKGIALAICAENYVHWQPWEISTYCQVQSDEELLGTYHHFYSLMAAQCIPGTSQWVSLSALSGRLAAGADDSA